MVIYLILLFSNNLASKSSRMTANNGIVYLGELFHLTWFLFSQHPQLIVFHLTRCSSAMNKQN